MIPYTPQKIQKPDRILDVPSAWKGLESILKDIVDRSGIKTDKALEFGVEYGYSLVAISNLFSRVVGVDTFTGDQHTTDKNIEGLYESVSDVLKQYPNIRVQKLSYQDYIKTQYMNAPFNLVHIDIVHTYEDTFACGDWALRNADLVLFHDTESFPDVKRAVSDLAVKHNLEFHNYPLHHGLGILCKRSLS